MYCARNVRANRTRTVSARGTRSARNVTANCTSSMTVQSEPESQPWPKSCGQNSNLLLVMLIHQGFLDHCRGFWPPVSCPAPHGVIFLPSFLPIGDFNALGVREECNSLCSTGAQTFRYGRDSRLVKIAEPFCPLFSQPIYCVLLPALIQTPSNVFIGGLDALGAREMLRRLGRLVLTNSLHGS